MNPLGSSFPVPTAPRELYSDLKQSSFVNLARSYYENRLHLSPITDWWRERVASYVAKINADFSLDQ